MASAQRSIPEWKHNQVMSQRAIIADQVCREYSVYSLAYMPGRRVLTRDYGWQESWVDEYQDQYEKACAEFARRCRRLGLLSPKKDAKGDPQYD